MSQFRNNLKPASGSVAIRPESSGLRKLIFRQEDPPTKKQLRRDEAESERSGERLLQAARRVSAANQYAGLTGGLWKWIGYEDGRRRLGGSASSPDPFFGHGQRGNRFQTQLQGIDHRGHRAHGVDKEVLQQMEVALKQGKVFVSA
jgi:hypothetical protein